MSAFDELEYLGDFSNTPPWHSRFMYCEPCKVSWTGCWDNFQCPRCGEGELPNWKPEAAIRPTLREVFPTLNFQPKA